jgi:hypothetical protein
VFIKERLRTSEERFSLFLRRIYFMIFMTCFAGHGGGKSFAAAFNALPVVGGGLYQRTC